MSTPAERLPRRRRNVNRAALARRQGLVEPLRLAEGITRGELARTLSRGAQAMSETIRLGLRAGTLGEVQEAQLRAVMNSLQALSQQMWNEIGELIRQGVMDAADLAVDQQFLRELQMGMPRGVMAQYADNLVFNGLQSAQDLLSRHTNGFTLSQRVYRNSQITVAKVGRIVDLGLTQQLSARQIALQVRALISPTVKGGVSYAANRLARTEINNAHHETTIRVSKDRPWVTGYEWHLSGSHPKPDICDTYATEGDGSGGEGFFAKGDVPSKPHPQCVLPETLVRGPALEGVTSRWFVGEVVNIHTLGGHDLTVTPNHPILTPSGWVAAGELHAGQYVVCDGDWPEGDGGVSVGSFSVPYNDKVPTRIENIANSFRPSCGMTTTTVPGSSEDFHGDGFNSDVHIVRPYGFLQNAVFKFFRESKGFGGDSHLSLLPSERGLAFGFPGFGDSPSGGIGGFGSLLSDVRRSDVGNFLMGSQRNTGSSHGSSNDPYSDPSNGRGLLQRLSGQIQMDQVTVLNRVWYSGHVHNLQTEGGYYTSNGIVTHNCLCYILVAQLPQQEFVNNLVNGDYDNYLRLQGVKG